MTYMKSILRLTLLCALVLAVSCVADVDPATAEQKFDKAAAKIINRPMLGSDAAVLVYVDKSTVAALDEDMPNALSSVAQELGALSVEHAIDMSCDVERRKAYGFDRWFVVRFDEEVDIDNAAMQLASLSSVGRVQHVIRPEHPKFSAQRVDASQFAATRSGDYRFNDPQLPLQWNYRNTGNAEIFPTARVGADANVDAAWAITAGRADVIVAVVDEGVDYTHEDLKDNMWTNEAELNGVAGVDDDQNGYVDDIHGWNFVTNSEVSWTEPKDQGHGTHVAGIVAATNNNGIGVSGVAGGTGKGDGVRMMSCQVFSNQQEAEVENVANAILYAADNGASVLQCSWCFPPYVSGIDNDAAFKRLLQLEYEAIKYFIEKSNCPAMEGGIVIFAAGNNGMDRAGYPSAYNEYIAVTAFGPDGLPAAYTNYDGGCNIAAPGGEMDMGFETGRILSTLPGNAYGHAEGTSMACPHVSGIAALALSYALDNGYTFTTAELNSMLLTSVNSIDSWLSGYHTTPEGQQVSLKKYQGKMGTGMVDAYRTLMAVRGTQCIPVPLNTEASIAVNSYLGDGNLSMKVVRNDFTISDEVREKLGIVGEPSLTANNLLKIHCTKPGCAMITIGFIAGDKSLGNDNTVGGKYIEKEFALVVREGNSVPNGWL